MDRNEGLSSQVELTSLVGKDSHNGDCRELALVDSGMPTASYFTNAEWPNIFSSRKLWFPFAAAAFFFAMKAMIREISQRSTSFGGTTLPVTPTVALFGNSMLYYNDCPRLLEILLLENHVSLPSIYQNSCLRGGANLNSLWNDGNGMQSSFSVRPGINDTTGASTVQWLLSHPPPFVTRWDFVVLQDDELYVTNQHMRNVSLTALRQNYLPQLHMQDAEAVGKTVVLLLETFPYQSARLRERIHLGGMDDFTDAVSNGLKLYQDLILEEGKRSCHIVPMATAVQYISVNHPELYNRLYNSDGVHPTPHCTWLQACLLVAMATLRAPPKWDNHIEHQWRLWARHWSSSPSGKLNPMPSDADASLLRHVACQFAGLDVQAC